MNQDNLMTVSQAMHKYCITRQAIYLSIYNHRLNAIKENGKWMLTDRWWQDYVNSKHNRLYTLRKGKKIYDLDKGLLSPGMVSEIFKLDRQRIYHLIRKKILPAKKCGSSYIIKRQDVEANKDLIFYKKFKRPKCTKSEMSV